MSITNIEDYFLKTYKRFPVTFKEGKGMYIYDTLGEKYLDFVAGIAVNIFGYGDTELSEVIATQANKLLHCSNVYYNEPQVELAKLFVKKSDFSRSFFCNSGTESLEGAIKLARMWGKKTKHENATDIITFNNSFHGRTLGAISATGQAKFHKALNPILPGFQYAEFNNIDSVQALITKNTSAIIIEPIQGEGGIIPADKNFLQELRDIADKERILLIFDEVQCGIGRTGSLFAYEHYDITPDVLCLAKGLGAGFPVGAILANEKASVGFTYGDHGSTYGGNPLACAVVSNVIKRVSKDYFLEKVKEVGEYLKSKLISLNAKYDIIKDVRGIGLMQGIFIETNRDEIIKKCFEDKLLLVGASTNVIRFVPPLICTKEDVDNMYEILDKNIGNL